MYGMDTIVLLEGRERTLHVHIYCIQVLAFYTARRRILKIAALLLNVVVIQERGARYVLIMLDEKQKKVGVIAASAGKSNRLIAEA